MKGYVYKFISTNGSLLYIGRTIHMKPRMDLHFSKGESGYKNIPREAIPFIGECVYTETESFADAIVLEAYLIAKYKPAYNREYMTDDELTLEIDISKYEWREWKLNLTDNPDHHIFVWENECGMWRLIYEVPKIMGVYTSLFRDLGIKLDEIPYGQALYSNGYKIMRLTAKRRVTAGTMRQIPKYQYMGYPKEINEWQVAKQGHEQ